MTPDGPPPARAWSDKNPRAAAGSPPAGR
jgi:hypothetical protein